jgi:hypothetical protein
MVFSSNISLPQAKNFMVRPQALDHPKNNQVFSLSLPLLIIDPRHDTED